MAPAVPEQNHAFTEVVARLVAAKLENEFLRQSLIPPLTPEYLGRIMTEQIPYVWMTACLATLKGFNDTSPDWASHPLPTLMWQVVNEELRARRQGRQLAPPPYGPGVQGVGQMTPNGGGGMAGHAHHPPGNCFKCG